MRIVQQMSDRLLSLFVPKVDADAIYVWQYMCSTQAGCPTPQGQYAQKVWCYCHESTGHCTNCSWDGQTCC